MEEANLKESNRHGNPSKSSRHATLSSSTFRLSGPSSLLVRTQGAVCLFVCVCVGVCVSLSLCMCVRVLSFCVHTGLSTPKLHYRSLQEKLRMKRREKTTRVGPKTRNKLQVWKLRLLFKKPPQQKKAPHGAVKNKKPRKKKKKKKKI
jgi:hypothetical protein